MWFGQKRYRRDGATVEGKWVPYETHEAAVGDGCELVSVLEICCSVAAYRAWEEAAQREGRTNPRLQAPFRGPFYADFDRESDVAGLQRKLRIALRRLLRRHHLAARELHLWFSGRKGFHLELPAPLFSPPAFQDPHLPRYYRDFGIALGFAEIMDHAVYSLGKGRLWRVAGWRRENGCRKIPISYDQLWDLTVEELRELSRRSCPEPHQAAADPPPNESLTGLFDQVVAGAERALRAKPARAAAFSERQGGVPGEENWREALDDLDALPDNMVDDYYHWLSVGMILHAESGGSERGFRVWNEWSRRSAKYDPEALARKWASFREEGGLGFGTLRYWAKPYRKDRGG